MKKYLGLKLIGAMLMSIFLTAVSPFARGQTYIPDLPRPTAGQLPPPVGYPLLCMKKTLEKWGYKIEEDKTLSEAKGLVDPNCFKGPYAPNWRPQNTLKLPTALWNELNNVKDPQYATGDNLNQALNAALLHEGAQCVFQKYLSAAAKKAATTLSNNDDYTWAFDVNIAGFLKGTARLDDVPYWKRYECFIQPDPNDKSICYAPEVHHIHEAIQNLATGSYASQCFTGLELVEYSAIDNLFGTNLENYFQVPSYFFVGDGDDAPRSASLIFGTYTNPLKDESGVARATWGPEAFIGAPGIIVNVHNWDADKGDKFLDDKDNRGENFMITRVSAAGVAKLQERNGARGYDQILKTIWQKAVAVEGMNSGFLDRLLKKAEAGGVIALTQDEQAVINKINNPALAPTTKELLALLNDPFLRDTNIYVKGDYHFHGAISTISYHLIRLAIKNSRTPFLFLFYPDTLHGFIFNRWVEMNLHACS
jgi:hypothetical protein